ncbi:hypothetical protein PL78_04645 [Yersinia entomophaga]|uniref:Lipoprotein n=1 Tax=Yersinia entomophaga TaxID=935293 RepID=A0ABM6BI34_YERET|nr:MULTISPECIES: hypothetical protein [Yersinia]ANI29128.1 hypothetical protein PL78_04645 [Yersinia entomophaga]OWF87494.1 hypothetical protein B4914_10905 [Yersinia entomophaga]
MRVVLPLAFLFISGCSLPLPHLTDKQIAEFDSDALCSALGTYNNDGKSVLRLTAEVERRGVAINQEKCYRISHMAMQAPVDDTLHANCDTRPAYDIPGKQPRVKIDGKWHLLPQSQFNHSRPRCSFGGTHAWRQYPDPKLLPDRDMLRIISEYKK